MYHSGHDDLLDQVYGYKELTIHSCEETDEEIKIFAWPMKQFTCPTCGSTHVSKQGTVTRSYKELPLKRKPTTLVIETNRFQCVNPGCPEYQGKRVTPKFETVAGLGSKTTGRLQKAIMEEDLSLKPISTLSDQYFVNAATINKILREKFERLDKITLYEPVKVLGIDEVHIRDNMRLVLVDNSGIESKLIDICGDTTKKTVHDALGRFKNKDATKYVTMDMTPRYRDAAKVTFPKATIIVDRFHVIKNLIVCMSNARKELNALLKAQIAAIPDPAERKQAQENLKFYHEHFNHRAFKRSAGSMTEKQRKAFARAVKDFPEVAMVYDYKEQFRCIYDRPTREEAEVAFDTIVDNLKMDIAAGADYLEPYLEFANKTVKNWRKEIFNYFDVSPNIKRHNAATEAINGVIKRTNSIGFGYHLEMLRLKMLYGDKKLEIKKGELFTPKGVSFLDSFDRIALDPQKAPSAAKEDFRTVCRAACGRSSGLKHCFGSYKTFDDIPYGLLAENCALGSFRDEVRSAAEDLDSDPPVEIVKRGTPLSELETTADVLISQLKAGLDKEFTVEY